MSASPVILVTGASRGLGRGIAECCARAGFSVAIHYAGNEAAARHTVDLCRSVAPQAAQQFIPVQGSLAVATERNQILEQTMARFGHLDALVNNAGMAPRIRADLLELGEASYDEVMGVNLKGPFFLSQRVARWWLDHPNASRLSSGYKLIFITSVSANTASVNRGEYCLSKAGLSMAAQLWALRLARAGVQVAEIRPGVMATDMTAAVKDKYDRMIAEGLIPEMRWGQPEDVGRAVESVLQGHLPYATGAVIHVDGGLHIRRL